MGSHNKAIIKPLSNLDTLLTAPVIRSLNTLSHAAGVRLIVGSERPLWTGYMHSICKGSHPLKSEVRILPVLDLNSSDNIGFCQQAGTSTELADNVRNISRRYCPH